MASMASRAWGLDIVGAEGVATGGGVGDAPGVGKLVPACSPRRPRMTPAPTAATSAPARTRLSRWASAMSEEDRVADPRDQATERVGAGLMLISPHERPPGEAGLTWRRTRAEDAR